MFNNCWVAGGGERLGYAFTVELWWQWLHIQKDAQDRDASTGVSLDEIQPGVFCGICNLVSLSLIQRQGVCLDLFVSPYTVWPQTLNCLLVSPYMKMMRHYLTHIHVHIHTGMRVTKVKVDHMEDRLYVHRNYCLQDMNGKTELDHLTSLKERRSPTLTSCQSTRNGLMNKVIWQTRFWGCIKLRHPQKTYIWRTMKRRNTCLRGPTVWQSKKKNLVWGVYI